jgi:hypothetical protein
MRQAMMKKREGWIDKDGIRWYSQGYINSQIIITLNEYHKKLSCLLDFLNDTNVAEWKKTFKKELGIRTGGRR